MHLLGVIAMQHARGHEVTLVAERDEGVGVPVVTVPRLALDVIEEIAQSADVVHVHNALAPDLLAWSADRGAVATVQDHRSFCPGRGKLTMAGERCADKLDPTLCAQCFDDTSYHQKIQTVTEERLAALCRMRAVTVLSDYMKRELVLAGLSDERIHVIPPMTRELDREAVASGPPCVLFVGRLVEAKGARDAALAHDRSGVALPLVFAGTGTLRAELEARHEVLGWQPHQRMGPIYRRARAVLMPSRWQEPFGIAGVEALSFGVPVVAYDSGGIREWHPGGDLLVPWGDIDALAEALRRAVDTKIAPRPPVDAEALTDALERVYAITA